MQKLYYTGHCNPSAAVALDKEHFIVADDEDNQLRIYAKTSPSQPLQTLALADIFSGDIEDGEDLEIDLEGAAEIDGTYFWIGSHSTSRKGQERPARQRLLALTLTVGDQGQFIAHPAGQIVTTLLAALAADARFKPYHFKQARSIQSKSIGGLNIEGLSATPAKSLLIGFRNPLQGGKIKQDRLINGKALVIELLNPFAVIKGQAALFADPIELDLQGLSIRDICWRKNQKYLIVAGPYHDNLPNKKQPREKTQLYSWSTKSGKLKQLKQIDLEDLNIETAIFYPGQPDSVQLLSDDGQLEYSQGFRSVTVDL
ncbi:MAG: DUF3616 domain-containing protein [Methylococcaceae bacterium]|nr:DUF3616 domain-containing protein [Methylococcaceae bacterium]